MATDPERNNEVMTHQQPSGPTGGPAAHENPAPALAGDLARRITHRRSELGMSVEDLASRAGVDPVYLHYFEANPQATLSAGTLQIDGARAQDYATRPSRWRGGPPPGAREGWTPSGPRRY